MKIVLTDNNPGCGGTELGCANGVTGVVWGFIPHDDDLDALRVMAPPTTEQLLNQSYYLRKPPVCVLVTIDSEHRRDLFGTIKGLPAGTVPIFPKLFSATIDVGREWVKDRYACPHKRDVRPCHTPGHMNSANPPRHSQARPRAIKDGPYDVFRFGVTQFPMVASYCLTDYKSQGKTMDYIIIDINLPSFVNSGQLAKIYVMLTRATAERKVCLMSSVGPCPLAQKGAKKRKLQRHDDMDNPVDTRCHCTRCVLTGGRPALLVEHVEYLRLMASQPASTSPARLLTSLS
jgi:hypothetical protein